MSGEEDEIEKLRKAVGDPYWIHLIIPYNGTVLRDAWLCVKLCNVLLLTGDP